MKDNYMPSSHFLPTAVPQSRRWRLVLLFILVYALDLALPRDLWVQDEARYGEVVREMIATGQWLIPHLGGYPYPDKPAPYFWLVAGVGSVVGHGEFAFRLVTFASTALAATGVYLVALRLLGSSAAFWSTLVFLTSFLTMIVGHIMRMDMLLTAVTVYAWYCLVRGRMIGPPTVETAVSEEDPRWVIAFWCLTTLGVMVKGPIALLFTLLPALAWLTCEDGATRGLRALRPLFGVLLLATLVGCWIGLVEAMGEGAYLARIWHEQLVGRAINAWSHREPIWFYLALLPLLFMPWTALLPIGMRQLARVQPDVFRNVLSFTLLPLMGLSLVSGKLFLYLEPIAPGLSILAGSAISLHFVHEKRVMPTVGWLPVVFFGVLAVGIGYGALHSLGVGQEMGLVIAALLLVLTGIAALITRHSGRRWLGGQTALTVGLAWLLFGVLASLINPLYSSRALGEYLAQEAPAPLPVGVVGVTRGILDYYAQRTCTEVALSEASAWQVAHPGAFLVVPAPMMAPLFGPHGVPNTCRAHRVFTIDTKEYYVVGGC